MTTVLEDLRLGYKPKVIRVLFIGESPPAGGTFFYQGDSNLAKYTQRAFKNVFGEQVGEGEQFLHFFKSIGCYLDDLCLTPINHLNDNERQRYRKQGVKELAERISTSSPKAVIVVMKKILPFVQQSILEVDLDAPRIESVPFPAQGNQLRYIKELTDALKSLQEANILPH